jgi:uncharacterized integral membrane protein
MTDEDGVEVTSTEGRSRGHTVRLVFALVLLVVAAAIVVDNRGKTRVGYVFGDVRAPLILVLVIAAAFGAAIGWLLQHRPHHN